MSEFGPWLFATSILVSFAYIFVNVPGSRKWFGVTLLTVALAALSTFGYSALESYRKSNVRHAQLAQYGDSPLISEGLNIEKTIVVLSDDNAIVVSRYLGQLKSTNFNGKTASVVILRDLAIAVQKAASQKNFDDSEALAAMVKRITANRFSKFLPKAQ